MSEKVKIVGICGSARHASTEWAVKLSLEYAEKMGYVETEYIHLGELNLVPCVGCMECFGWHHPADAVHPVCYKFMDDAELVLTKMMESDGVIFGSPVYTLGMTALARIITEKCHMFGPMSFTKFSGRMRNKPAGVITVGGGEYAGQEPVLQDFNLTFSGIGMIPVGTWPNREDPNPQACVHGGAVSGIDARSIYGRENLSKAQCRTMPPTQGARNEHTLRNLGRHTAVMAMTMKLGVRAFEEKGFKAPELIPFPRYSVKPRKGSWIQHLIDIGKVQYVPKQESKTE